MSWARPLSIGRGVVYDPPFVLAPMEGVTHRVFRDLILDLGGPGAAWTEFLRVSQAPLKAATIRRELGPPRLDVPVGVQLMATQPDVLAETTRNAVEAGAPTVDLNFGCPAPIVFDKCAGSALLAFPERIEGLVRAAVQAVSVPVTAKIRLGTTDSARLGDVLAAVEQGGAAAVTVHARTRQDGYSHPARWEELTRARALTRLPLVGNGDVLTVEDARRMLETTGVDAVMIGRGALRDPWIFSRLRAAARGLPEPVVGPDELLALHARYRDDMRGTGQRSAASDRGTLGQLKQWWRRLDVVVPIDAEARTGLLRSQTIAELEGRIDGLVARARAGERPAQVATLLPPGARPPLGLTAG